MKSLILIIVATFLFHVPCYSQETKQDYFTEKLSVKALIEDIDSLALAHETYDVGYYHYRTKPEIDSVLKIIKSKIEAPKTRIEFHRLVMPYFIAIGEGHNYSFYSKNYYSDYISNYNYDFPFKILYLNGKYLLYNKDHKTSIPDGSELKGINNKSIAYINTIFQKSLLKDANIPASVPINYYINKLQRFWSYYITWVSTTVDLEAKLTISYLPKGKKTIEHTKIQMDTISKENVDSAQQKKLEFKNIETSSAYMRVGTFYDRFKDLNYEAFLKFYDESFKKLKENKIKNLIIDLRGNSGGRGDLPYELAKYLTKKRKITVTSKTVIKDSLDNFEINPITKDTVYGKGIPPEYKKQSDGMFHKGKEYIKNDKRALAFKGEVYLLIDEGVFSAGAWFSSFFKENKIGVIVGRESSGHCGGTTAGMGKIITLKNTQLQSNVCFIRDEYPIKNQVFGRGVIPNIEVPYTKKEVIDGEDIILEKTLSLIKAKQK
ncbi:S41 family peptidase [Corallibacter sp.]|uniref:S41 family peptidase n=1 Tax=Corallibacter sp. TaxID=2038084 RepID=UPI003AB29973